MKRNIQIYTNDLIFKCIVKRTETYKNVDESLHIKIEAMSLEPVPPSS